VSGRSGLNLCLLLALLALLAVYRIVEPRDVTRPNYDFLPETQMAYSVAYDSFTPNPNFPDGVTRRSAPPGTIARGNLPLHYQATPQDALLAGRELRNPFSEWDVTRRERGIAVFTHFCQVCHGPTGQGNTPVTQRGFPPTPSLLADRAVQMRDGQMFHIITYGQGNMPSHAAQLSRDDRWCAILHVRRMQSQWPSAPPGKPGSASSRIQDVAKRFQQNCAACHGEDGSGSVMRKVSPLIPDFSSLAWQSSQTDMAIVNQIDYGSHPLMPSFRYKFSPRRILELAVYVRTFTARPAAAGASAAAPGSAAPGSAPGAANVAPEDVFRTYCFSCHDSSGRGNPAMRASMPELPDFTAAPWQKSRTDADLSHSILEGKGKFMLPMKDKLGTVDVKQMVAVIRSFKGGKHVIPVQGPKLPGPPAPHQAAPPTAGANGAAPAAPPTEQPLVAPAGETAARIRVGAGIFRQFCIICHGPDGTGSIMRARMPPIPNFTSPTWQKAHTSPQLLVSVLDGKGTLMPANRGRVTEEQARDLVAYVRAFGPKSAATKGPPTDGDFEKSIRKLEAQWDELHNELQRTQGQQPPTGR